MNILNGSENLTKKEIYMLSQNPAVIKMKDAPEDGFIPVKWLKYEDMNAEGEIKTVLTIMDSHGNVYGTISPTFIETFDKIVDCFGPGLGDVEGIVVRKGVSNAGREFIMATII